MRIFNTVQELWSYCLFCPLCKEYARSIELQVGPDDLFRLSFNIPYEKIDDQLELYCIFAREVGRYKGDKRTYAATFLIDCNTNQFFLHTSGDEIINKEIDGAAFHFYAYAKCAKCKNSYINTAELEFDNISKRVRNIQMEREGYYLVSENDKYHVTQFHELNVTGVSRIQVPEQFVSIEEDNVLELPLLKLDFSDIPRVVEKIKTLILFS
jgi:hypothetical protein